MSTSQQENYGISVIEAVRHGCRPLLPNRLSYPEIIPDRFRAGRIYGDFNHLVELLANSLAKPTSAEDIELSNAMSKYSWEHLIGEYDARLSRAAADGKNGG